MIRFILACLSVFTVVSCSDVSQLEDLSVRPKIVSLSINPDTLRYDASSAQTEMVSLQITAQTDISTNTYSPQILVERDREILLLPSDVVSVTNSNGFTSELSFSIDTRSNSPITISSALQYENGESSDFFLNTIVVESDLGSPPVIDSVNFPSEIIKPSQGAIPVAFNAYVTDDDGLSNIDVVTMSIFDTDGNAVGSPLQMYDDGSQSDLGNGVVSGDTSAGDGNFTRTLQIEPTNTARTLVIRFSARDKAGQDSNVIEETFTIVDP